MDQLNRESVQIAAGKALEGCRHGLVTFTRGCLICGESQFAAELIEKAESALDSAAPRIDGVAVRPGVEFMDRGIRVLVIGEARWISGGQVVDVEVTGTAFLVGFKYTAVVSNLEVLK